jgi:hypothetical protein
LFEGEARVNKLPGLQVDKTESGFPILLVLVLSERQRTVLVLGLNPDSGFEDEDRSPIETGSLRTRTRTIPDAYAIPSPEHRS